jgi:hypothetical protein
MAIVWHYNKKHYRSNGKDFGFARFINRNVGRFLSFSMFFGVVYYYVSWHFQGLRVPLMSSISSLAGEPLCGHTVGNFVRMIALGFVLNHYYLDQRIWRVNRDASVAKRLGVSDEMTVH